jgi:hypothetical protein
MTIRLFEYHHHISMFVVRRYKVIEMKLNYLIFSKQLIVVVVVVVVFLFVCQQHEIKLSLLIMQLVDVSKVL